MLTNIFDVNNIILLRLQQDIINFVSIVVSDCTFKTKVQTKPKLPKTVAMDLGLEKDLKKDIYNYYLKVTQNLVIG